MNLSEFNLNIDLDMSCKSRKRNMKNAYLQRSTLHISDRLQFIWVLQIWCSAILIWFKFSICRLYLRKTSCMTKRYDSINKTNVIKNTIYWLFRWSEIWCYQQTQYSTHFWELGQFYVYRKLIYITRVYYILQVYYRVYWFLFCSYNFLSKLLVPYSVLCDVHVYFILPK